MKKKFLVLSIFFLVAFSSFSQIEYPIFKDSSILLPQDSGKIKFEFDNLNYIRNYEYFGKIPLSYTLFGYQIIPQVSYQPNESFLLKAGAFVRREFGRKGFVSIDPLFTVKYQRNNISILLGALEGSLNHRFIEPVYNVERIINDRLEQGAQLIVNKKKLWLDVFIDWEKAIVLNSPFREEFTSGLSSRVKLINNTKVDVEVPLQVFLSHMGGQIDTSSHPGETLMNLASGLSLSFPLQSSILKRITTDHYFVYYEELSKHFTRLYENGVGWFSSLVFKSRWNVDLDLRYWKGNRFFGPRGGPLYSSISEKDQKYGEPVRSLFFASLIYDKQIFKNFYLDIRFEPYYDLQNKFLEYSYSYFLRFKKDFTVYKHRFR